MKGHSLPHLEPDIRIYGDITEDTVRDFLEQLQKAKEKDGPIVLELTTLGGDAEAGRRIATDIKLCRRLEQRDLYFLGKTTVYSIGAVIMSAFEQKNRFLAECTRLMIHERRIDKEVHFNAALSSCIQSAQELLSQFETGYEAAREDFEDLAKGSKISAEEILKRAKSNWYIKADEALELGLIAGII